MILAVDVAWEREIILAGQWGDVATDPFSSLWPYTHIHTENATCIIKIKEDMKWGGILWFEGTRGAGAGWGWGGG